LWDCDSDFSVIYIQAVAVTYTWKSIRIAWSRMGLFNEVIDDVVKHVLHPCESYLVHHLLEFCSDDQRLQIVLKLTKHPDQLVTTSLDSYE